MRKIKWNIIYTYTLRFKFRLRIKKPANEIYDIFTCMCVYKNA